jgi:hypothetical protein
MELQHVPPVDLGGFPYVPVARDADGNAIGGIRLPHMPSRRHGRPAGAPLGSYTGLDLNTPNPVLLPGRHVQPVLAREAGRALPDA